MKPTEANAVPYRMARSGGDALNSNNLRTLMHGKHLLGDGNAFGRDQMQLEKADMQKPKFEKYEMGDMSWMDAIPSCPVFYPTMQDFEDPLAYIHSIASLASNYGICKIVSPVIPGRSAGAVLLKEKIGFKFTPRVQPLRLANWDSKDKMTFLTSGRQYSFREYEKMANKFYVRKFSTAAILPPKYVEAMFWQEMASAKATSVEYGCDIDGSAFSTCATDPLGKSKWNLKDLSRLKNSTLRLLEMDIAGVTEPMLYIGMLFSMFAWHVEDHYLYSINYHHCGASKTWYGVPGHAAPEFENVVQEHVYDGNMLSEHGVGATYDLLIGKTTMFPPNILCKSGVPVYRAVQAPGEFVITFPRAYHAGFSHGFNCGEAVNFATVDWFPFGAAACQRYELLNRMPLLPHEELLCKEAMHIAEKIREPCMGDARVLGNKIESENDSQIAHRISCDLENSAKVSFVRLIHFQHKVRWLLKQCGANTFVSPGYVSSVTCALCKHMCYIAFLRCQCFTDPICLNHAKENRSCNCGSARTVVLSCNIAEMEAVGQKFVRTDGILGDATESNLKKDACFKMLAPREENLLNSADYSLYVPLSDVSNIPGTPPVQCGDIEGGECSKAPKSKCLSSHSLLGYKSRDGELRKSSDKKSYINKVCAETELPCAHSQANITRTNSSPSKLGARDAMKGVVDMPSQLAPSECCKVLEGESVKSGGQVCQLPQSSQTKRFGLAIRSMPVKIPSTMSSARSLKKSSKESVSAAILEVVDDNNISKAKRQCVTLDTARLKKAVVDTSDTEICASKMASKDCKIKETLKTGASSKTYSPHRTAARRSLQDVPSTLRSSVSPSKILAGGNISKLKMTVPTEAPNQQLKAGCVRVKLSPKESSNDFGEHRLQIKRKFTAALKGTSATEDAATHATAKFCGIDSLKLSLPNKKTCQQTNECQSKRMKELLRVAHLQVASEDRKPTVKRQKPIGVVKEGFYLGCSHVVADEQRAESRGQVVYSKVEEMNSKVDEQRAESSSKVADIQGNRERYLKKPKFEVEDGFPASCPPENGDTKNIDVKHSKFRRQSSDPLVSSSSAQSQKISIKPPLSDRMMPRSADMPHTKGSDGYLSHKDDIPRFRLIGKGSCTFRASIQEEKGLKHITNAKVHVSDHKAQVEQCPVKVVSRLKIKGPSSHDVLQEQEMDKNKLAQGPETTNLRTGIKINLHEGSGETAGLRKRHRLPEQVVNTGDHVSVCHSECNSKESLVSGRIDISEQRLGPLALKDAVRSLKSIYNSTATLHPSTNEQEFGLCQSVDKTDARPSQNMEASEKSVQTGVERKAKSHTKNFPRDIDSIDKIKECGLTGLKEGGHQSTSESKIMQLLAFQKNTSAVFSDESETPWRRSSPCMPCVSGEQAKDNFDRKQITVEPEILSSWQKGSNLMQKSDCRSDESRPGFYRIAKNCGSDNDQVKAYKADSCLLSTQRHEPVDPQETLAMTMPPVAKAYHRARHDIQMEEQMAMKFAKVKKPLENNILPFFMNGRNNTTDSTENSCSDEDRHTISNYHKENLFIDGDKYLHLVLHQDLKYEANMKSLPSPDGNTVTMSVDAGNGLSSLYAEGGSSEGFHSTSVKQKICDNYNIDSDENVQRGSLDTLRYKHSMNSIADSFSHDALDIPFRHAGKSLPKVSILSTTADSNMKGVGDDRSWISYHNPLEKELNETACKMVKETTQTLNAVSNQGQDSYTSHLPQSYFRPSSIPSEGNQENHHVRSKAHDISGALEHPSGRIKNSVQIKNDQNITMTMKAAFRSSLFEVSGAPALDLKSCSNHRALANPAENFQADSKASSLGSIPTDQKECRSKKFIEEESWQHYDLASRIPRQTSSEAECVSTGSEHCMNTHKNFVDSPGYAQTTNVPCGWQPLNSCIAEQDQHQIQATNAKSHILIPSDNPCGFQSLQEFNPILFYSDYPEGEPNSATHPERMSVHQDHSASGQGPQAQSHFNSAYPNPPPAFRGNIHSLETDRFSNQLNLDSSWCWQQQNPCANAEAASFYAENHHGAMPP